MVLTIPNPAFLKGGQVLSIPACPASTDMAAATLGQPYAKAGQTEIPPTKQTTKSRFDQTKIGVWPGQVWIATKIECLVEWI